MANDLRTIPAKLIGAAGYFVMEADQRPTFFAPYQSLSDFSLRAASIVTAPFMLSTASLALLLLAGSRLLEAFSNLVEFNFTSSKKRFVDCGAALLHTALFLIDALLSPLINLIDLIGGAITSIINASAETTTEQPFSPNI